MNAEGPVFKANRGKVSLEKSRHIFFLECEDRRGDGLPAAY
jgi:hypothetical protein